MVRGNTGRKEAQSQLLDYDTRLSVVLYANYRELLLAIW
jgi:hypothetical protein